jgi:hypothetical protein
MTPSSRLEISAPPDLQKRIIQFVTDYLNRGYRVRDAVAAAIRDTQTSYGDDVELGLNEEAFEKLAAYFERALETYRANKESGSVAVGEGVYVDVVKD